MNPRLLRPRTTIASPKSISGLTLWLDASNSGSLYDATSGGSVVAPDGAVARWEDQSGNANHAVQSTANNRPLLKTAVKNAKSVLRFDGTNDGLQVASLTLPTYITVLVVSSTINTLNLKFWMEHGASIGTSPGFFFNGIYSAAWAFNRSSAFHAGPSENGADWIGTGWALATLTYNGVGTIYKNAAFVSSDTFSGTARSNTDVSAALNIACRNQASLFLKGDIGEIIIYNRVLSASELASLHAAINKKWSVY